MPNEQNRRQTSGKNQSNKEVFAEHYSYYLSMTRTLMGRVVGVYVCGGMRSYIIAVQSTMCNKTEELRLAVE